MPKLIIDDREIEVAPGTKVIEAAAQLGIMIPRFCYHPALGSVGACRVCAVKFIQGPFKGVQMSCMIDAADDMVVSTTDQEAVDFRKRVIEWLMLNHPHDCPVCDAGGHCLLQDMTIAGGHGIRNYLGNKRTYIDQYLGPLVQHEMNRCIHCYRCSRYYQEFSGYRDLGALSSANRTYFGRHSDGILESPFSGNLIDICPTGVYTDKPSRYFGRRWDYRRSPALCINCSLGCNTIASVRYREVKRQEARFSEDVNGHFICDRGRYGFFYSSLESRPRRASLNGEQCDADHARRIFGEKLSEIEKKSGPGAIAVAVGTRSSLETYVVVNHLCRLKGWNTTAFFENPHLSKNVMTATSRLEPQLSVSLRDVEKADFILAVGADPINEAPMLAMAMRQAQRKGADVVVVDPRPITLPFALRHLPAPYGDLSPILGQIIKAAVDAGVAAAMGEDADRFYRRLPGEADITGISISSDDEFIQRLQASKRPIIICGSENVPGSTIGLAADFALLLQAADKAAGLFYLMPGANAFAGGLLGDSEKSMFGIIEEIEKGSIRALILVETDPFRFFPDRRRLEDALGRLDVLVVSDYLISPAVRKADVFLPTTTIYETGAIFINQEGRLQASPPAFLGGTPIAQTGGGDHPPRIYDAGLQVAEPVSAGRTFALVGDETLSQDEADVEEKIWKLVTDCIPELANYESVDQIPAGGIRVGHSENTKQRFVFDWSLERDVLDRPDDAYDLVLVDWTFGTEELSSLSLCLQEREQDPCLVMHSEDAQELEIRDGYFVEITTDTRSLQVMACTAGSMARGMLFLPRHPRLPWQIFGDSKIRIKKNQIKKRE
jgi:NADH-quinone oxidoreductase subunit G